MSKAVRSKRSVPVERLSREMLGEVVRVFSESPEKSPRSWNIVEVLELLIDAGHFKLSRTLAERVIEMVQGDGRERLFQGYAALCTLMIDGTQTECLNELERLYIEIDTKGHSVADRVRSGLLLARALAICTSLGSLPQSSVLRARSVLGVELDRACHGDDAELYAQVVLELSKAYLHAPTPDPRAAFSIIESAQFDLVRREISRSRLFDIRRVAYQAFQMLDGDRELTISEDDIRDEALLLGGVAPALAELAIARRAVEISDEKLEKAAELLEKNQFLSGAFEAVFVLATAAVDRGHNVVAERLFMRAFSLAEQGGFAHGSLLALVGLFQAATISENSGELKEKCASMAVRLESELALGSSGLNVAAAQQIIGDMEAAAQTARRCEQFFSRQGLPGYQAQALAIIGTCEAHAEKWDKAGVAWSKALDIDERRHAFIQACERRGLVVQAWVMHDMTTLGHLSERTVKQAEALLVKADSAIERLGDLPDAVQARARLQSVHAQLCLMSKQHVRALRHLSTARELFESMNAQYDVAMVDAFTGLSMIEVGKGANPNVLEEAVLTLQRAHQFFSRPAFPVVRWKVLYYMSLAGLYVSNMQSDPLGRVKWRELSMSWLRSAEQDLAEIADGKTIVSQGGWSVHTEFSPGLEPEAVQVLKRALGVRERSREKRKDSSLEKAPDPGDGYLH